MLPPDNNSSNKTSDKGKQHCALRGPSPNGEPISSGIYRYPQTCSDICKHLQVFVVIFRYLQVSAASQFSKAKETHYKVKNTDHAKENTESSEEITTEVMHSVTLYHLFSKKKVQQPNALVRVLLHLPLGAVAICISQGGSRGAGISESGGGWGIKNASCRI